MKHAWGDEKEYKTLYGVPEEKKIFERSSHEWEDNINTKFK
jgi:hypothetical protein